MMELESLNGWNNLNKYVCSSHFNDYAIKGFIRKNSEKGYCDYCKKYVKVVSLESLVEFMMYGISFFYEDPANFMSYNGREGGYLGKVYSSFELIVECIELDTDSYELSGDIITSIEGDAWARPDLYYHDDTERDYLMYQWSYFKNFIKHKSRYLFQQSNSHDNQINALAILRGVGEITKSLRLIKKIDKGTLAYRCRQHSSCMEINEQSELVAPPPEKAIYPNRFSPSGISMLYIAFDEDTAISETLNREDKDKDTITIATFKLKKEIYVLDFSRLPRIPSIFDYRRVPRYYHIQFLHDLVKDFTKKIEKNGQEHTEYVPTQVVTEYFRYPFNKNRRNIVEGIIYPSSVDRGKLSSVIFWDNKKCLKYLDLVDLKVKNI